MFKVFRGILLLTKQCWRKRVVMWEAKEKRLQRDFFPGALQVQETPPSPTGRSLLWVLLILLTLGVCWATWGEIDIVVTAQGRIVPSGKVKLVQALETAAVVSIDVSEGQRVTAGQRLLTLDSTSEEADDLQVLKQIKDKHRELSWRYKLEQWFAEGRPVNDDSPNEIHYPAGDEDRSIAILRQQQDTIASALSSMEENLAANGDERRSIVAELERARSTLSIVTERMKVYETLLENEYGARIQYLEILERKMEMEKTIPVLNAREQKLSSTAKSIESGLQSAESEYRLNNLIKIEHLSSEITVLEQESKKLGQRRNRRIVTSPVTGTVEELAVHSLGGVVTPAQALMKIVPEEADIEVEAMLSNKDFGFVYEGQTAAIKLDAFNFTKYGLIDAEVADISHDSVKDEVMGWVFPIRISLSSDEILVEEASVALSPGMSVTAEIKTGSRRLIEFFLSPLLRYRQESVRER